jgi:hypothetical protein
MFELLLNVVMRCLPPGELEQSLQAASAGNERAASDKMRFVSGGIWRVLSDR